MMRSLYSGVSGLRNHQTRMDVIGNNIANVNTVGFRASQVTFRDVLYQNMQPAGGPTDTPLRGGTNPIQIGLGMQTANIRPLNTQAAPMTTDRPLDLFIGGEGYFAVWNPGSDRVYFTRVGSFQIDEQGNVLDDLGNFVLGFSPDSPMLTGELIDEESFHDEDNFPGLIFPGGAGAEGSDNWQSGIRDEITNWIININFDGDVDGGLISGGILSSISIGPDGIIRGIGPPATGDEPQLLELGRIYLFKFPNPDGLEQVGNTYLRYTANSGKPAVWIPGSGGTGQTHSSRLEMSNVELAKEFTDMIITQRGFQANSRIITVSDEMLQELVNLRR